MLLPISSTRHTNISSSLSLLLKPLKQLSSRLALQESQNFSHKPLLLSIPMSLLLSMSFLLPSGINSFPLRLPNLSMSQSLMASVLVHLILSAYRLRLTTALSVPLAEIQHSLSSSRKPVSSPQRLFKSSSLTVQQILVLYHSDGKI